MIKMRLIVLALTLCTTGYGQQKLADILPLQDGKVVYTGIVKIDGVTRDELHRRAKRWIARTCDAFYLDDQEELIGKLQFIANGTSIWQTVTLQIKDGRYKYNITDFRANSIMILQNTFISHTDTPLEETQLLGKKTLFKTIDNEINEFIISLEKSMKMPLDNNW